MSKDFTSVYIKALDAAKLAYDNHIKEYGEGFMCGFAWVHFENGRAPFVNWLKKNNLGSKHWRKGYILWNPAKCGTQSIDVLESSARAFANVLRENGIDCNAQSRLD